MDDKELIDTLISTGSGLPPVNPYLDDDSYLTTDDSVNDQKGATPRKTRKLAKSAKTKKDTSYSPLGPNEPETTISITPDPKEYIAELERIDDEDELYAEPLY